MMIDNTVSTTTANIDVLEDMDIDAVSGGVIPFAAAAAGFGLGVGAFSAGFAVGQAIWGD